MEIDVLQLFIRAAEIASLLVADQRELLINYFVWMDGKDQTIEDPSKL